ncbi:hypothetical protein MTO96_033888 [Rhipicephalus appendiculatus]
MRCSCPLDPSGYNQQAGSHGYLGAPGRSPGYNPGYDSVLAPEGYPYGRARSNKHQAGPPGGREEALWGSSP